jgi:hypothetical protein
MVAVFDALRSEDCGDYFDHHGTLIRRCGVTPRAGCCDSSDAALGWRDCELRHTLERRTIGLRREQAASNRSDDRGAVDIRHD